MRSDELYKELERGDADYDSRLVFFLLFFSCCIELLRLRYARLAKTYIDSTCFEICCLQAHLECILHAWRSHSADNSRTTQFDRLHEVVELVNPSCQWESFGRVDSTPGLLESRIFVHTCASNPASKDLSCCVSYLGANG